MADLLNRLTALQVTQLDERGYHADGGGLYLAVSKTGTKSWIFRYDWLGKRHEMGLGSLNTVSLKDARTKARDCRQQLLDGINPLAAKRAARKASAAVKAHGMTFDRCAKSYISAHTDSWKNTKHSKQWTATLDTYASPKIGNLDV